MKTSKPPIMVYGYFLLYFVLIIFMSSCQASPKSNNLDSENTSRSLGSIKTIKERDIYDSKTMTVQEWTIFPKRMIVGPPNSSREGFRLINVEFDIQTNQPTPSFSPQQFHILMIDQEENTIPLYIVDNPNPSIRNEDLPTTSDYVVKKFLAAGDLAVNIDRFTLRFTGTDSESYDFPFSLLSIDQYEGDEWLKVDLR